MAVGANDVDRAKRQVVLGQEGQTVAAAAGRMRRGALQGKAIAAADAGVCRRTVDVALSLVYHFPSVVAVEDNWTPPAAERAEEPACRHES